jgi:hypothetical protein
MIARPRVPSRRTIEVCVVVATYALFLIVGVYGGQTRMSVELISPPNGTPLQLSPVELIARVTIRGVPVANVTAKFTVNYGTIGETETETKTDSEGIARLIVLAVSGSYSWYVTAMRQGYPTIASRSRDFSVKLLLAVEPLLPLTYILAISPVDFKARVTENGHPVQSANVTFYVDSRTVGSNLTRPDGIAQLSKVLTIGSHTWFASASKEGQGGISETTSFLVGQLASLATDSFCGSPGPAMQGCGEAWLPSSHEPRAARIRSSSALNE